MEIIRKEFLKVSQKETDALNLVMQIASDLEKETQDPQLKDLAKEIYNDIAILWGWGE